jgi:hypothetical protein
MPRTTRTAIEELGRVLASSMRGQADQRILRKVKGNELGRVLSINPLQIMVEGNITRPVILGANEVAVLPTENIIQGMAVMLLRTANDQIMALPAVPGYDLQPLTSGSGDENAGDGDPYAAAAEPAVGGPAGDRVIAKALSYVGTKETGTNTDGGGKIDEWITKSGGIVGQPWCGYFAKSMYREAGVDDEGIAHGATSTIVSNAQAKNRMTRTNPVKGCMAVTNPGPSGHVTLYISGPINAANTVGGNQSDGVTTGIRNLTGAYFCIPKALTEQTSTSEPNSEANADSDTPANRPNANRPRPGQER